MVKRLTLSVFSVFLALSFTASVFAQNTTAEFTAKLREVRQRKAQITNEYQNELGKVNKAAEDKLAKIKADFHKAREECLTDKNDRCGRLNADYKAKIDPVLAEEKRIMESMGPGERMNFAKSKSGRGSAGK